MDVSHDNKDSQKNQGVNDLSTEKVIDTPLTPRPRIYEGKEYYGASDVAKILGVGRTTVLFWEQQGLFTADVRVLQLLIQKKLPNAISYATISLA